MQRWRALAAAVLALAAGSAAFANAHKEAPLIVAASAPASAAQAKKGECNRQAAGKSGEARQAFLRTCLASEASPPAQNKTRK